MKLLQKIINDWQEVTFNNGSGGRDRRFSILNHFKREVAELEKEMEDISSAPTEHIAGIHEKVRSEIADCQILLFGLASSLGVDLETEVLEKMKVNFGRKWGAPDKEGVIEHIENDE